MIASKGKFAGGIFVLALMGGLLGGFNMVWGRDVSFPLYGIIIDLCAMPVMIMMILYVRRLKMSFTDEFSVTKKRYAAQSGFLIGFALFLLSGVLPVIFPVPYHHFIASLDGADDGFIMGRVAGMVPFVLGLLIGQIGAWLKYR